GQARVVARALGGELTTGEPESLVRGRARAPALRRVVPQHGIERAPADASAGERDTGLALGARLRDLRLERLGGLLGLQLVLPSGGDGVADGELFAGRLHVEAGLLIIRVDLRVLRLILRHHLDGAGQGTNGGGGDCGNAHEGFSLVNTSSGSPLRPGCSQGTNTKPS